MIRCRQCGEPIEPGERIVIQHEAVLFYRGSRADARPVNRARAYWHKRCKPWKA